ncbi:hypothetical protein C5167_009724 [Papaver somniferum]|uniref:Uncharacterized protein n=1 Tax=Papaver somniferum TaxID=3469 RepID=A0A4Y7K1B1_PAPSO|nr:hypothetical protein C5167_009724 [Papaver somniferum]
MCCYAIVTNPTVKIIFWTYNRRPHEANGENGGGYEVCKMELIRQISERSMMCGSNRINNWAFGELRFVSNQPQGT